LSKFVANFLTVSTNNSAVNTTKEEQTMATADEPSFDELAHQIEPIVSQSGALEGSRIEPGLLKLICAFLNTKI
jgi:hypothetical protein